MTNRVIRTYRRAFLHVYGWATVRLYHELAWAYDPISRFVSNGRWGAWRGLVLDYVAGPRVLELGFGTGELLIEMRHRRLAVTGLDFSREMHRVAARKLAAQGVRVPLVRGCAETLPFASGSFNTVLSTFPAGYILEPVTLRETARVLAPSGRLVIGGLSVQLQRSVRYRLSIVPGGSWERLWAFFQAAAAEAGLAASLIWREDEGARVPILVCTTAGDSSAASTTEGSAGEPRA